ncbi:MAG: sensor histidine kinase [Acidimicrobiales bacterium]
MGDGDDRDAGLAGFEEIAARSRFLDLSLDLLGICDLETRLLEVSDSWKRVTGWSRNELLGTPLVDYFHPDDMPRITVELAAVLEGSDAPGVPVRLRCRDGSYRWVQGNARPDLPNERIYVTAADIDDRMRLEEALVRRVELEEVVVSITSRFVGTDADGMPAEIERGMGELAEALGADRAHFLRGNRSLENVSYFEWLHPTTGQRRQPLDPAVTEWWFETMRSGITLQLDDVMELADQVPEIVASMKDDGIRSLLHVPLPFMRGTWGFLALVSLDRPLGLGDDVLALLRLAGESFMTALARADDSLALMDARSELEHRNAELERSNEELERFAYAAAHDLKAPLARIEMALSAVPRPADDAGLLVDVARRGAARMRQMIEDLLAFSSVGRSASAAEEVDLEDLLRQVLADLEAAIQASGAEVVHEPLPTAWGNRGLLGQVLQNVVGNSLKFVRDDVAPRIEIAGTRDARGTTLRIADNGIGVDPVKRDDVFGVFTRLHSEDQYPGSGIGLATCAKIVAYHGGEIAIEDGIDGGIAIVIWLPAPPPT